MALHTPNSAARTVGLAALAALQVLAPVPEEDAAVGGAGREEVACAAGLFAGEQCAAAGDLPAREPLQLRDGALVARLERREALVLHHEVGVLVR